MRRLAFEPEHEFIQQSVTRFTAGGPNAETWTRSDRPTESLSQGWRARAALHVRIPHDDLVGFMPGIVSGRSSRSQ
jgi:hypothetical protein